MISTKIYSQLSSVRIMEINKKPTTLFFFNFDDNDYEKTVETNKWTIIFHRYYNKYIVTNDINECGLNDLVEHIEIVGFADDLHYSMFVIYEHQKSLGMKSTIQDEIREVIRTNNLKLAKSEWKWATNSKSNSGDFHLWA